MKIHWDMTIYNKMSSESRRQCDDAKSWILDNKELSFEYFKDIKESHPALWFSRVMTNVESGIDNKEVDAVDLGCTYVINAQKAPFGKIHKSNILVRLIRNNEIIEEKFIPKLAQTFEKLKRMKYPPREVRELSKLIKLLC